MAPVTLGLIGLLFHSVTVSEFALLIVGGMAFVSISRGRLLGSRVRIDARQFPEVHVLVGQAAPGADEHLPERPAALAVVVHDARTCCWLACLSACLSA